MGGELPVCERCCFCLPLRYGLIAWGYFKLIALTFFITATCISSYYTILKINLYRNESNSTHYDYDIAITSIVLILLVSDLVLTTVFIVGGHMKNVKLLRAFYFYSIALWVITVLLIAVVVGICLEWWLTLQLSLSSWMMNVLDLSIYFVYIALQTYSLLLVRSEIIKLRNNCEFRFVNNTMEPECTMKYNAGIADEEKETENV